MLTHRIRPCKIHERETQTDDATQIRVITSYLRRGGAATYSTPCQPKTIMFSAFPACRFPVRVLASILLAVCCQLAIAQTDDPANGESDPVKLFERGQDAHAKNDYKKA